jgi:RNA polymerase sigma factor (sigma-70 family)
MDKPLNDNTFDATARLVKQAQAGDKTAMKTLILAFKPLIYKTAGPFPDFEDAVSDFNLDLIKAVKAFDAEKGVYFPVYLKNLIRLKAKKRWTKIRPDDEYFDTTDEVHPGTSDTAYEAYLRAMRHILKKRIETRLSPRQEAMVYAYYLYGLPVKTIAKRQGCSEDAVKKVKRKGLKRLREAFEVENLKQT